jgi:hypothetical protein
MNRMDLKRTKGVEVTLNSSEPECVWRLRGKQ